MVRNLTTLFVPPVAVCRYGCKSHCAPAVAVVWLSGILLLAYFLFGAPHANDLVRYGSLGIGSFLVVMAGIWAFLTLKRVDEEMKQTAKQTPKWCNPFASVDERDPLKEVDRANHL